MRDLFSDGLQTNPVFAGAAEAMRTVKDAGIQLALVSSNAEANVRTVLGPAAGSIDHYACGSGLWGQPGHFRSALKALRVSASAAIGIGDEVRDVDAAREVRLSA